MAQQFGLSRMQLWDLSFQAIGTIFGGVEEKARLTDLMLSWRENNLFQETKVKGGLT